MSEPKFSVGDEVKVAKSGQTGKIYNWSKQGGDYWYSIEWSSGDCAWYLEKSITLNEPEDEDEYEFKVGDRVVQDEGSRGVVAVRADSSGYVGVQWDGSYGSWVHTSSLQLDLYEGSSLNRETTVDHPTHYTSDPSGIECIEVTRHRNFNIGNAMKYLWRNGLKDADAQVEDLRKAVWYIEDEIKRLSALG